MFVGPDLQELLSNQTALEQQSTVKETMGLALSMMLWEREDASDLPPSERLGVPVYLGTTRNVQSNFKPQKTIYSLNSNAGALAS